MIYARAELQELDVRSKGVLPICTALLSFLEIKQEANK